MINDDIKVLIPALNKEWGEIHIITDSQNCIKLLKHDNYVKDDAMQLIYEKINQELSRMQECEGGKMINMHWVESHKESIYNDEVDGYAKIAAKTMQFTSTNDNFCYCRLIELEDDVKLSRCDCHKGANNWISYDTIKS